MALCQYRRRMSQQRVLTFDSESESSFNRSFFGPFLDLDLSFSSCLPASTSGSYLALLKDYSAYSCNLNRFH